MRNLARLCQGALYLEAVTREDWEQDMVDQTLTDARQFRHRAQMYRRTLAEGLRAQLNETVLVQNVGGAGSARVAAVGGDQTEAGEAVQIDHGGRRAVTFAAVSGSWGRRSVAS